MEGVNSNWPVPKVIAGGGYRDESLVEGKIKLVINKNATFRFGSFIIRQFLFEHRKYLFPGCLQVQHDPKNHLDSPLPFALKRQKFKPHCAWSHLKIYKHIPVLPMQKSYF